MTSYKFKINGKPYEVSVNGINAGVADVTVNGASYSVEIENAPASAPAAAPVAQTAGPAPAAAPSSAPAAAPAGGKKIVSPLPGVVIDVCIKEGEAVKRGQKLAVLEAMKMENEIMAPHDATVVQVLTDVGTKVDTGTPIIVLG